MFIAERTWIYTKMFSKDFGKIILIGIAHLLCNLSYSERSICE